MPTNNRPPSSREDAQTPPLAPVTEADLRSTIEMLGDRAEYWQAKYEGLRSGIVDEAALRAAESMVAAAAQIARTQNIPFRLAFTSLMEHMYGSRAIARPGQQRRRHERRKQR